MTSNKDEIFETIWQIIKDWDIQRKDGEGYAHATGTDIETIVEAVQSFCTNQVIKELESLREKEFNLNASGNITNMDEVIEARLAQLREENR